MWITKHVDLPYDLVEAHSNGRLVLFVGAGASIDAPTNQPSFGALAGELAELAGVDPPTANDQLDQFLGSFPVDFNLHVHASRVIAREEATFNPTHAALLQLANAGGQVRIVTTNFDTHLSAASVSAGVRNLEVWESPALPLGDDFTGIVQLHGSVLRDSSRLVLTDRDFGRAYLTDAWVTRFLQKMFDNFTVLFIGYSHDDPIMRYLALGLRSGTKRYVLTHALEDPKWAQFGITPIAYPVVEDSHAALPEALSRWAEQSRMGRLDHFRRMEAILRGTPPLKPVDEDYIRVRVRDPEGALQFAEFANGPEWLNWMEGVDEFQKLFKESVATESSYVLSRWFSDTYASKPEEQTLALSTVMRLGLRFCRPLFDSLARATEQLAQSAPTPARRWKVLLGTSIDGLSKPVDTELLLPFDAPEGTYDLVSLRIALRPYIALERRFSLQPDTSPTMPQAVVKWRGYPEALTSHLKQTLLARPDGDSALGSLLEETLCTAYDMYAAFNGDDAFDTMSFNRSAIEPHPQDRFPGTLDAVIDALRDYGMQAIAHDQQLLARWWARDHALFRRLALHVMINDPEIDPDRTVEWIIGESILYEFQLKHELYALLSRILPKSTAGARANLLSKILDGPDLSLTGRGRDKYFTYSVYNLLVWLTQHMPTWSEATFERKKLEEQYSFQPREHPDLDSWSSEATWVTPMALEVDSFQKALETDATAALKMIFDIEYSELSLDGPTWENAQLLVKRTVEEHPLLGKSLWCAIDKSSYPAEPLSRLRNAVVAGWTAVNINAALIDICSLINSQVTASDFNRVLTQFLLAQVKRLHAMELPELAAESMRRLAVDIWKYQQGSFSVEPGVASSYLALNSWPGDLAQYWILEIERRWKLIGDSWAGLSDAESKALQDLMKGPEQELRAIRPALATETFFLFSADADFTKGYVFPLFTGDSADEAWEGYLHSPRFDNRMLAHGFMSLVEAKWTSIEDISASRMKEQFYALTASIAIYSDMTPPQRDRLLKLAVRSNNGAHAADFAGVLIGFIQRNGTIADDIWDSWLGSYIQDRLQGVPRNASKMELEKWADVAPFVGSHATEAFTMLSGQEIGLGKRYREPDWPPTLIASHGKELIEYLAERIRNSHGESRPSDRQVEILLHGLQDELGVDVCKPLTDAAMEAGFIAPPKSP